MMAYHRIRLDQIIISRISVRIRLGGAKGFVEVDFDHNLGCGRPLVTHNRPHAILRMLK